MGYLIININPDFKKIIICILLTIIFFCKPCFNQRTKINFQSLQNGLSNQQVKCIIKDSKGFIWFGTGEGLNKYDGSSFTVYENNVNDSNSLINNHINCIIEDKNYNLWIGTAIGISIYNRGKNNFTTFKPFGQNLFPYITSLLEDNNNNIWIGTAGNGMYLYDIYNDKLNSYLYIENDSTSISSNFVYSIIADKKNRIWAGTRKGLNLFDKKNNEFIQINNKLGLSEGPDIGHIKILCLDTEDNLWIGTYGRGLYKLIEQNNNWQLIHYLASGKQGCLSHNDILSLISDEQGNLWIGTENGGLNFLPVHSNDFIVYKAQEGNIQSISSNSIWSLYQDNTGIIWIGTYNQGLNLIDEKIKKFELYQRNPFEQETLVNNNVMNFSEDMKGNIWIATDGGGISCFNTNTRNFTNKINNALISSRAVMAVLCDSEQRIWIGTWGGGIELFDISGKKIKNYRIEAYKRPSNILCLMEDKSGNIWAGSGGNGLLVYNPEIDDFVKVEDITSNTHLSDIFVINYLFQDSENTFWIGITNSLISIKNINGKRIITEYTHSLNPQSISNPTITAIFEDSRHNIWIGTNDGLNLLNKERGTFTSFRKEDGLPNNNINGILEDENYSLWISTYEGLSKFDIKQKKFNNYSQVDGLLSNNFNPRSCLKTRSGEFFYGSNYGFVAFFPDSIKMNTYIPPVYFTDFKIFNNTVVIGAEGSPLSKSISETRQITLNYKQTSFTIEFVALNFTHAAKNQYAYMLEGFDKDWIYSNSKHYASYTNIDAGKYIFKVMGSNNEGIWNPDPIQLDITVLPPFWKTKLAYLFYLTCIILILWGFIRLLIIKSNQAERLKLEKINHDKSEELNRMKIQFFANISHEFRTPLSLILAPLKEIIENEPLKNKIKTSLELVFRNANKLYGLINELMDFTKSEEGRLKMMVQKVDLVLFASEIQSMFIEEAKRRNIIYTYEKKVECLDVWIDKSKMEKIIGNLLSNAFKYTDDGGEIILRIDKVDDKDKSYAKVCVIDNGSGISEENIHKVFDRFYQSPEEEHKHVVGTGIGLALVKSLVELHQGTINVTSKKWKETVFAFKIPLGNSHFNKNEILDESSDYFVISDDDLFEEINTKNVKKEDNAPILLIVEDNSELREYLSSIFSNKYKVLKAADGIDGIKIAQESIPDLIISDVGMPRLSGFELCKIIKNEMSTSHIPIILLTSKTSTSDKIEGTNMGADVYITKPFDIKHLKVTIEKTIETRRKLYQRFSQDIYLIPNEVSENELDRKFLKNIIEYINENASDNFISVENLASHLLMSRTHVYRKIKAITGQSATEFIKSIRLKMAVKLLETGKYNISEIAFNVGFSSPGYFTKCFKDYYGKSPSEYIVSQNK